MSDTISIAGLDKAEVLAALYNASKPQGLGFLHFIPRPMTVDEARELLGIRTSFDYLHGRVMKISLDGDSMGVWLYDRDNGSGAAERALLPLIQKAAQS